MPPSLSPRVLVHRPWQLSPRHDPTRRLTSPLASTLVCLAALLASPQGHAGSSNLQVSSLQIEEGATISIIISIHAAPNEAGAFGLELSYNIQTLSYANTFIAGELTQGFTLFDVNEAIPGTLIVAGVAIDAPIAPGASGVLVFLDFDVLACPPEASPLLIENLVDDFETWTTAPGSVECGLPILLISDDVLRIPATAGSATLSIQNGGEGELMWEAQVVAGSEWLSLDPSAGTMPADFSITTSEYMTIRRR